MPQPRGGVASPASPVATSLCMFASDALAVLVAVLLGVSLWGIVNPAITLLNCIHVGVSLILFPAVYAAFGLYSPAGLSVVAELRRIILGSLLVSLTLAAAVFLTKDVGVYSRGVLLISGALVCGFVPVARAAVRSMFASKPWWGVPVLVLGAGRTATLLVEKLRAQPGLGLKPVACLDDDDAKQGYCAGVPVPGPLSLAPALAAELQVRHLLVAMPGVQRERLVAILERYGAPFARIIVIPDLFGMASLWVSTHDMGGVLALEVRQNLLVPANRLIKRMFDLVLAGLFGILALPLILVAAVWVKRVSPGPAFYSQGREGAQGWRIRVRKLRTMFPDAEELLTKHLESSPAARAEWDRFCKLRCDPRVLPGVGHLLRRTSLDELPQLWNVIKGEMSLVGPRPFPKYHLDRFSPQFRALRAKVRPGLTGLWQVSARSDGDLAIQEELDSYYIRNWSLWLDLYILARTVSVVVRGCGAY